jgi:hypothetical protein
MAGPDQLKIPNRSADRLRENQPRRPKDAVAGPVEHVLSLQRTLGNRATSQLVRSWRPAGRLVQRALRGKPDVVSARNGMLNVVTGPPILEEFARNDPRSVPSLVGVPADVQPSGVPGDTWSLDEQEWGLICERTTGEVHLIFGSGGLVDWTDYLDEGTPLAHSHPWRKREKRMIETSGGTHSIAALVPDQGGGLTQEQRTARQIIVPTVSDFVVPATQGQREHTVFTPYAVDAQANVSNPQGAGAQRLVWELSEIQLDRSSPDKSDHRVTGRLTAKGGGTTVWTRRVQAPARNDTEILKSTGYTVIGR